MALSALAAVTAVGATAYGFLENSEPTLKLWSAILLAVVGSGLVLLAHPIVRADRGDEGHPDPLPRTRMQVLIPIVAMLSMSAALVHFAVIREHWKEYWLYGAFFVVVAIAQLVWALLAALRPARWLYVPVASCLSTWRS